MRDTNGAKIYREVFYIVQIMDDVAGERVVRKIVKE